MIKLLKFLLKIAITVVLACLLIWGLSEANLGVVSTWATSARTALVSILGGNSKLCNDAEEIFNKAGQELEKAASSVTNSAAKAAIEQLKTADLGSWKSIDLPANARAKKTINGSSLGVDASITLYQDDSYITISDANNTVTLEVPSEYRTALAALAYI